VATNVLRAQYRIWADKCGRGWDLEGKGRVRVDIGQYLRYGEGCGKSMEDEVDGDAVMINNLEETEKFKEQVVSESYFLWRTAGPAFKNKLVSETSKQNRCASHPSIHPSYGLTYWPGRVMGTSTFWHPLGAMEEETVCCATGFAGSMFGIPRHSMPMDGVETCLASGCRVFAGTVCIYACTRHRMG
jgi:hypothetical protein